MSRPSIYVASPLGFSEPTRVYYRTVLLPAIARAGFELLDPWVEGDIDVSAALAEANSRAGEERVARLRELDMTMGRRNVELLDAADGVLAVLDGPDVDSGTAAEIGYAASRRLPVVGLRTDTRQSGENDGCFVNLQVDYFISSTGGTIVDDLGQALERLGRLVHGAAGAGAHAASARAN
jgi:nucleoside 2-deoxyribosyltransferase